MKLKRRSLLLALGTLLSTLLPAQISPEAQALIEAYNEATGGTEAKQAISSLIQIGTCEMPNEGITCQMTIYIRRPSSYAMIMEIPDIGTIQSAFEDGDAWENNSITGFRTLEGTELQQAAKDSVIFPETQIADYYQKATVGEARSDGMIPVLLIDHDGMEETWYFDPLTNYLVEVHQMLDAGVRGSYRIKATMRNYAPVGALMMPSEVETSTPAFSLINRVERTEINTDIPDYVFRKPQR